MGKAICSSCGKSFYWHSGHGSKQAEIVSPCHQAPSVTGKMILVLWPKNNDSWTVERKKVFVVNGRLEFSSWPRKVSIEKIEDGQAWFVADDKERDRTYDGAVSYYRIEINTLKYIDVNL